MESTPASLPDPLHPLDARHALAEMWWVRAISSVLQPWTARHRRLKSALPAELAELPSREPGRKTRIGTVLEADGPGAVREVLLEPELWRREPGRGLLKSELGRREGERRLLGSDGTQVEAKQPLPESDRRLLESKLRLRDAERRLLKAVDRQPDLIQRIRHLSDAIVQELQLSDVDFRFHFSSLLSCSGRAGGL